MKMSYRVVSTIANLLDTQNWLKSHDALMSLTHYIFIMITCRKNRITYRNIGSTTWCSSIRGECQRLRLSPSSIILFACLPGWWERFQERKSKIIPSWRRSEIWDMMNKVKKIGIFSWKKNWNHFQRKNFRLVMALNPISTYISSPVF